MEKSFVGQAGVTVLLCMIWGVGGGGILDERCEMQEGKKLEMRPWMQQGRKAEEGRWSQCGVT